MLISWNGAPGSKSAGIRSSHSSVRGSAAGAAEAARAGWVGRSADVDAGAGGWGDESQPPSNDVAKAIKNAMWRMVQIRMVIPSATE